MANRLRGEASFEHDFGDGEKPDIQTLTLVLDAEALLQVEDATGFGLFSLSEGLGRLRVVATLLAIGVGRGSGQKIAVTDAVEILASNDTARAAVLEALDRALPAPPEEDEARPPKAPDQGPGRTAKKRGAGKDS